MVPPESQHGVALSHWKAFGIWRNGFENFENQTATGVFTFHHVLGWLNQQFLNRDLLKTRKEQQDEAEAAKQFTEPSEPLPNPGHRFQRANAPTPQRVAASTTIPPVGQLPMKRYRRKWKRAVPGLNEFARSLQIPEEVHSKILGRF